MPIYKPQNFPLPNRRFPRFLFSDVFITQNNIGLISIVYPDERIDFNTDISNEVNGGYCKGTIVFIIFIDQEIFYSSVAIFVPR